MERIFRAAAMAVLVMLAACGPVEANQDNATSSMAPPASGADVTEDPAAADEIRSLLPPDAHVLATSQGDINADGRPDMVVALDNASGEDASGQRPGSLLLFVRDAEGHLQLSARNDRIVPCASCGGSLGAPSIQLRSASGTFMLTAEGGTGWLWSNEYSFTHQGNNRWQLGSIARMATHRTSHETTLSKQAPADFGVVDFAEFDPETIEDGAWSEE